MFIKYEETAMSDGLPFETIVDEAIEKKAEEISEEIISGESFCDVMEEIIPDDTKLNMEIEPAPDAELLPVESEGLPLESLGHGFEDMHGRLVPNDMKSDFDTIRSNLNAMISNGMTDLANLSTLARESDHPRVYEVLSTMMGTMKSLNDQLLTMNEKKHKILQELEPSGNTTIPDSTVVPEGGTNINNAVILSASTADIQRIINEGGVTLPTA